MNNEGETLTEEHKDIQNISPKLQGIIGAVKLPADFDEKRELGGYLEKKHL